MFRHTIVITLTLIVIYASCTDSVTGSDQFSSKNTEKKINLPKKCGTAPQIPASLQNATVEVTSLADSLDPLKNYFNANKDRHRFVALLSPT